MSTVKTIRLGLNMTQSALAEKLGCTAGNVGHYERDENPQGLKPDMAIKLIEVARGHGLQLTMDQVYGLAPLPPMPQHPAATASP